MSKALQDLDARTCKGCGLVSRTMEAHREHLEVNSPARKAAVFGSFFSDLPSWHPVLALHISDEKGLASLKATLDEVGVGALLDRLERAAKDGALMNAAVRAAVARAEAEFFG